MLKELYQYIGCSITHDGRYCQLIEILEDGPSLVFKCPDEQLTIQTNQHGDASRKVAGTYTVPLLSSIHHDLHPVVKTLIPEKHHQAFIDYFSKA